MRGGRAKVVLVAAALVLLALTPSAAAATRPRSGAVVSSPPLLNWPSRPGAVLYNVQLFRQTAHTTRKVLSRWPSASRYQLHQHWHFRSRRRRFTVARYFWYVWPWYGSRYGALRVNRSFIHGRPPLNTSPPTLTGGAREGATLTASAGTWTGLPQPTLSYRWQQCRADGSTCTDIPSAAIPTYRVGTGDIDRVVRIVVVATNIARTVAAPSAPSPVIRAAPPNNVSRPAISGHPHIGSTLTVKNGQWLSSRPVTFSYHWLQCSLDGTICARITGATARTYRVRAEDEAHRIEVVVRAANSGGANLASSPRSNAVGRVLRGTGAANLLFGTPWSDALRAGAGNDTIYGGRGGDRIVAGRGADSVYGGPGPDVILSRDSARDRVSCGTGEDTVHADRRDRVRSNCEHVTRG